MLALSEKVWHIPQFLQPEQCQQLLGLALQHGFVPAQVRPRQASWRCRGR